MDLFLCVESLSCDYGEKVLDDGDFQLLPWFRGLLRNARIALTDRYNRECLTRKLCTHHLSTIFSATSNVTCIERNQSTGRCLKAEACCVIERSVPSRTLRAREPSTKSVAR